MNTIGQRVFEYRGRAGLTQRALAELSGTSDSAIASLERGQSSPVVRTMAKIATALGCGLVDLLAPEAGLVDLSFPIAPGAALGQLADLEQRMAERLASALPGVLGTTVSIWPWMEPPTDSGHVVSSTRSALRLRACPSVVGPLADLAGRQLLGADLGVPSVRPVQTAGSLRVLVAAKSPRDAKALMVGEAHAVGCLASVQAHARRPLGRGQAWWCTLLGVSEAGARLLVGHRVAGPDRLYVAA